ncbi:MAG TPA: GNAT family N-acetyltransferase [Spirochaetota bacterium]|nr:GNAT family N-acetyltransferase [Spirochaetota bacterium]HRZ25175.1 GNAT family N-acetyltransferase [Spirochaetota bacterium]HSA16489.1 GNAT family N-acetyltransferase [Spirochaetota bacterium]
MKDSILEIVPLDQKPDCVPILAWWAFMEWYRDRNIGFDILLSSYRKRSAGPDADGFLVACLDSLPVGMVSLKMNDLWSLTDINPWLASLYVCPEFRRRGIGGSLITALLEKARSRGHRRIYLYLSSEGRGDLEKFYITRGWLFYDRAVDNDGRTTDVLYREL